MYVQQNVGSRENGIERFRLALHVKRVGKNTHPRPSDLPRIRCTLGNEVKDVALPLVERLDGHLYAGTLRSVGTEMEEVQYLLSCDRAVEGGGGVGRGGGAGGGGVRRWSGGSFGGGVHIAAQPLEI